MGDANLPAGAYEVAGDQWLAETSSSPNSWNLANSDPIDYHGHCVTQM